MPNFSYVQADPRCPNCGAVQTDLISFQWGYLPGYGPRDGRIYRVGDPIVWRRCGDGTVPDWTFFHGGEDDVACNAGSPAIRDLHALDLQQSWLAGSCGVCGKPMGGAAVEIREGIIVRASILPAGGLGVMGPADLWRIEDDGTLSPIPEQSMAVRMGCGALAFWSVRDGDLPAVPR